MTDFERHIALNRLQCEGIGDQWRRQRSAMWVQYWIAVGMCLATGWALGIATAYAYFDWMGWLFVL